MILGIDVDNVICNLQEVVVQLFNERNGTNYTLDDFTDYDVANVLSVDEAVAMKKMYGESGIYSNVRPIAGSQEALKKLINDGHQVYLVTDALPQIYNEKVEWLRHFFPFIDDSHIIAMRHKHLFNADVLIEDNMQNLLAGHLYDRICFDYPWNRSVNDYVYGICRCVNWNEVIAKINSIKGERGGDM